MKKGKGLCINIKNLGSNKQTNKKEGNMKRVWSIVIGVLVIASLALAGCVSAPSAPPKVQEVKEPYRIAISAALTGPISEAYLGTAEGLRIYLQRVNDRGGINGRKIEFKIENNENSPVKVSANFKKLIPEMNPHLLVTIGLTSTEPASVAIVDETKLPMIASIQCSTTVEPPKPHPLIFGTGASVNGLAAMAHQLAKYISPSRDVKVAALPVDSPSARAGAKGFLGEAEKLGYSTVMSPFAMTTLDFSPIISKLVAEEHVAAINNYTPSDMGILMYDALTKAQGGGKVLFLLYDMTSAEKYLEFAKGKENVILFLSEGIPFRENLPQHQEIREAAAKYGVTDVWGALIRGWYKGQIIEEVLKRTDWPPTPERLVSTMNNFEMNLPLRGGVHKWTETDHAGFNYVLSYRWDKGTGNMVGPNMFSYAAATGVVKEIKPWWK